MHGDFTRFTYDPSKRYTAVLKQQGRVDLDADWNEQAAIADELDRMRLRHLIGPSGVPRTGGGFQIGVAPGNADLTISRGKIYVDGILCELDAPTTYLTQADYPKRPALTAPVAGRVDFVYLDVWQRHISAIEDAEIRETALGGPDTTTRVQTVWQVKVQEAATLVPGAGDDRCKSACPDGVTGWPPAPSGGRVSNSVITAPDPGQPCVIAPTGNYRGLENRLYRVEIQSGGGLDAATFKWSRDNGSVVYPVEEFSTTDPTQLTVKLLGRDQVLALHEDDWVEVLDDAAELANDPALPEAARGKLVRIVDIDVARRVLTLSESVTGFNTARHARVRRWDQGSDAVTVAAGPLPLEDGIEISFSGTDFRPGDYWTFAARAISGTIEPLSNAAPRGIEHHYAALALITWTENDGQIQPEVSNCPIPFPPLTDLLAEDVCFDDSHCAMDADTVQEALETLCGARALRYVSGDGQEGLPEEILPGHLIVGVEDGVGRPVPNAVVVFTVTSAQGGIRAPGVGSFGNGLPVTTDAAGLARVELQLGTDEDLLYEVTATLDSPPQAGALPIVFHATVRCADDVCYEDTCKLGVETVQEALDALCGQLVLRYVGGDGQEGPPNTTLPRRLTVGVEDGAGRPVQGANVAFAVTEGGGAVSPASVSTDANGLAECQWTLGPALGALNAVQATLAGAPQGNPLPVIFRALAESPAGHSPYLVLRLVGGDGQEGPPGSQLPCPLIAGVEDEHGRPVAEVTLRFEASQGDDRLAEIANPGNPDNGNPALKAVTNTEGLAEVAWTLGKEEGCHEVRVSFADPPPQDTALVVRFEAAARRAPQAGDWPTVIETTWRNDQVLPLEEFNRGLGVRFSETMHPATATLSTFIVTLELAEEDPTMGFGGWRSHILRGRIARPNGNLVWVFIPTPVTADTLGRWVERANSLTDDGRIRCRVRLIGHAILDEAGERPLDGDSVFQLTQVENATVTDLAFPSGDGTRGGDFESWFFLAG